MDIITSLFQQDVFLAVASYLAAGSACLVYFLYREKKWERELAQYQIDIVKPRHGVREMQPAEIYRPDNKARKLQPDEMRVVADEVMDTESPQRFSAGPSITGKSG